MKRVILFLTIIWFGSSAIEAQQGQIEPPQRGPKEQITNQSRKTSATATKELSPSSNGNTPLEKAIMDAIGAATVDKYPQFFHPEHSKVVVGIKDKDKYDAKLGYSIVLAKVSSYTSGLGLPSLVGLGTYRFKLHVDKEGVWKAEMLDRTDSSAK